ncbi:DUF2652 domain-containing protein [Zunongwangia sp.]|uniref:DUF2652 domain-containing protein n=1 Tax=Zunongwangia sp. TaxID=1965325 RepID=UPI003AA90EBC
MALKSKKQLPYFFTESPNDTKVLRGTVIMPDISGFSKFVENIDVETGKIIISKLLNVIVKNNILDLQISEIEGDAILFYKFGKAIPVSKILKQYELIYTAFFQEIDRLKEQYKAINFDLSIKLIAHFGYFAKFNVGTFEKLYGKTVVEIHRLLKNSISGKEYVLITNSLIKNTEDKSTLSSQKYMVKEGFEIYDENSKINYTYFKSKK